MPVVVVSHAPLSFKPSYHTHTLPHGIPTPSKRIFLTALIGDIVYRKSLLKIIRQSGQVVLTLAGHWHIHDKTVKVGWFILRLPHCGNIPLKCANVSFIPIAW
jgi:hypothetical protein